MSCVNFILASMTGDCLICDYLFRLCDLAMLETERLEILDRQSRSWFPRTDPRLAEIDRETTVLYREFCHDGRRIGQLVSGFKILAWSVGLLMVKQLVKRL